MSRLHIQVDSPSISDGQLPAYCVAKVHGEEESVILWESYINHRSAAVVYLSSCNGRYLMLPEKNIVPNTIRSFR